MNSTDATQRFVAHHARFQVDTQAAGIARIPAARWTHGTLVVDYA